MDFSICLYGFTSEKRSYAYFHEFRILELAFEEQPPRAKKGQRTALFQRLRSFSILRIFSLSFFFSYFFPIILYRVFFFHDSGQALIRSFFLLLFPHLFYFLFYFNTRRSHYRSAHVLRTLCSSLFYYRNLV